MFKINEKKKLKKILNFTYKIFNKFKIKPIRKFMLCFIKNI